MKLISMEGSPYPTCTVDAKYYTFQSFPTTARIRLGLLNEYLSIWAYVPLVDFRELTSNSSVGENSATIRERVMQARQLKQERFRKSGNATNATMSPRQMKAHCQIDAEGTSYLEHAMEEMNFSARAYDRILKVARTLADLTGAVNIRPTDVLEAIQYRSLDRKLLS